MKKRLLPLLFSLILIFAFLFSACTPDETPPSDSASPSPSDSVTPKSGDVLWECNFSGSKLDMSSWNITTAYTHTAANANGNAEAQYYHTDNVIVDDGLILFAQRTSSYSHLHSNFQFTSGKISTQNKVSVSPGSRIEARIKLPVGNRLWPAFWMLSVNDTYGTWPLSGEIDIMENRGDQANKTSGAIHFGNPWPGNQYKDVSQSTAGSITSWHTYAVEWETTQIRWYVDGKLIEAYTQSAWFTNGSTKDAAPFDKDFYIILNLAVGSNSTKFTSGSAAAAWDYAEMNVEYVRIIKL